MKNVVITTCTQLEAVEIEARLKAENIPVSLLLKNEAAATAAVGGLPLFEVCVRAEDEAHARQLLQAAATPAVSHSMAEVSRRVEQGLRRGETQEEIIAQLMDWGWPEVSAQKFVQTRWRMLSSNSGRQVVAAQRPQPRRSEETPETGPDQPGQEAAPADFYLRQMLIGLAWLVGGVLLTLIMLQSKTIGIFFIGPIFYGGYQFFSGLVGWWQSRK